MNINPPNKISVFPKPRVPPSFGNKKRERPSVLFAYCMVLYIEAEDHHVPVLHDIVLALAADESLLLAGVHGALLHKVVVADYLRPNEPPLMFYETV